LPEYAVTVQADPDVTWWGYLTVYRDLGQGESRTTTRIPGALESSTLDFWELALEHADTGTSVQGGRITKITLQVFKTDGEGFLRAMITRDGEVVAEDETDVAGAAAYCEFD